MIVWTTIVYIVRGILRFFLGYRSAHLVRMFAHVGVVLGMIGLLLALSIATVLQCRERRDRMICGWNLSHSLTVKEHEVTTSSFEPAGARRYEPPSDGSYHYLAPRDDVGAEAFVGWHYYYRDRVKPPPGEDK